MSLVLKSKTHLLNLLTQLAKLPTVIYPNSTCCSIDFSKIGKSDEEILATDLIFDIIHSDKIMISLEDTKFYFITPEIKSSSGFNRYATLFLLAFKMYEIALAHERFNLPFYDCSSRNYNAVYGPCILIPCETWDNIMRY